MRTWEYEYEQLLEAFPRLDESWFPRKLEQAKAGDEEARVLIIGSSLWVAWEIAREFEDLTPLTLPELTQVANTALLDGLNTYLGEDAYTYGAHISATIRDRLLKLALDAPVPVG